MCYWPVLVPRDIHMMDGWRMILSQKLRCHEFCPWDGFWKGRHADNGRGQGGAEDGTWTTCKNTKVEMDALMVMGSISKSCCLPTVPCKILWMLVWTYVQMPVLRFTCRLFRRVKLGRGINQTIEDGLWLHQSLFDETWLMVAFLRFHENWVMCLWIRCVPSLMILQTHSHIKWTWTISCCWKLYRICCDCMVMLVCKKF